MWTLTGRRSVSTEGPVSGAKRLSLSECETETESGALHCKADCLRRNGGNDADWRHAAAHIVAVSLAAVSLLGRTYYNPQALQLINFVARQTASVKTQAIVVDCHNSGDTSKTDYSSTSVNLTTTSLGECSEFCVRVSVVLSVCRCRRYLSQGVTTFRGSK